MNYKDNQLVKAQDLWFKGILQDVKKSKTALQPIFECFTNALEAIKMKQNFDVDFKGEIVIKIYTIETTETNTEFCSLSVTDNGIGFSDEEFERFNTYKRTDKGFKNLGSGRIQFVHYFNSTTVKSVFEQDGKYFEREFVVSKRDEFLSQNAIVNHKYCKETDLSNSETTVTFAALLENSSIYNDLNENTLKVKLLEHYIPYFCYNKDNLPKIIIEFYIHANKKGKTTISLFDVPKKDDSKIVSLQYSRKSAINIEKIDKTENFTIDGFKISNNLQKENKLNLVSKGEIIEDSGIYLKSLASKDIVDGNNYLFLVSSNYIDARDTNMRGVLNIPSKEKFFSDAFANEEEIFLEDIQEEVNKTVNAMYPEIEKAKQKHFEDYTKLKKMFLLDDETEQEIGFCINDNETDILNKFYVAEAKKAATLDVSIKSAVDQLNRLDTTASNYLDELTKEVEKLVKTIPLQNKKSLTHYVARRKLVLELLEKVLDKKLEVQQSGREKNEALIHDLLFQRGNNNPENSDLWIINEEFIYFKGSSNIALSQVKNNGEKIFKDDFSAEEEKYLQSLGENRKIKKPDVLLFPEEGKCIIIEFKAPDVNVSDHLTQIDKYASLIRNYTNDKMQITTFYGYLLGENIEPRDVLGAVSSYEESYQFDYLFRPSTKVFGFNNRSNGSIYTEVIKYSTLLERAKQRNKIFIDKLQ